MISLQFFSNCSSLLLFQINKARFFFIFHESWRKLVKWNWKTTSGMQKKQKSKRTYCMKLINATKVSRRRNGSFTHILRFLHFSNETLHKITVWKIETTNSNNRVSSSKFIITCWCYRSNVLLRKKVFSRFNFITFLSSLLLLENCTTILQLMRFETLQLQNRVTKPMDAKWRHTSSC